MSDSDARPEPTDERLDAVIADLAEIAKKARENGAALLTGPASVQFMSRVDDALTPEEAVDRVINGVGRIGFNAFVFAVTDMLTGESFYIQGGKLLSQDEVKARSGEPEAEDDGASAD